jgi:hypothetical protein
VLGEFSVSTWGGAFEQDCEQASRIRIASGFMDVRGARTLAAALPADAKVSLLVGVPGCSGPDVVTLFEPLPNVTVRGSRVPEFHWKVALLEGSNRVAYVGSANFTNKGLGGRGELMVRLSGKTLDDRTWGTLVSAFEEDFQEGMCLSGAELTSTLERLEDLRDTHVRSEAVLFDGMRSVSSERLAERARASTRGWFVVWHAHFTEEQTREVERQLGPCPDDEWARGMLSTNTEGFVGVDEVVLAYDEQAHEYLLGQVRRVATAELAREVVTIVDLELVRPVLSAAEDLTTFKALRAEVLGLERFDGGRLTVDALRRILNLLAL